MRFNLLYSLLILISGFSFSQSSEDFHFAFRVKQLDEFFARFNFAKDILGNTIAGKDSVAIAINNKKIVLTRRLQLSSLMNSSSTVNRKDSSFIDDVCLKGKILSFYDDNWFAEATCNVIFKGKEKVLKLILKNEVYPGFKSKWVISGADADFLNDLPEPKDTNSIISPVSNDLNFLELSKVFTQPANTKQFFDKNLKPDALTNLISFIQDKSLLFKGVKNLRYHFLQVDNWIFTLDFFNREEGNSGWLISEIISFKEEDKAQYKKQILKINI